MIADYCRLKRRLFRVRFILLGFILLMFGCQSSVIKTEQVNEKNSIEGEWVGKWFCEKTGHEGFLRCKLRKIAQGKYQAAYSGFYAKFIPFWYTIEMDVIEQDGVYTTQAQANLGWLGGGLYTYKGTIQGSQFQTRYDSKQYAGTFELTRQY